MPDADASTPVSRLVLRPPNRSACAMKFDSKMRRGDAVGKAGAIPDLGRFV